jgi:hypothetical protein
MSSFATMPALAVLGSAVLAAVAGGVAWLVRGSARTPVVLVTDRDGRVQEIPLDDERIPEKYRR